MNLLEYQAKIFLEEFGVPTPRAVLIQTAGDLEKINNGLFASGYVVKAQVLAGARGKAGGVQIVASSTEAKAKAKSMLGSRLATHQTQGAALTIDAVLVAEKLDFEREFYLAIVLDRKSGRPMMLASKFGGIEIEEVSKEHPDALIRFSLNGDGSFDGEKLQRVAIEQLELTPNLAEAFVGLVAKLGKLYFSRDLMLLEINPLVLNAQGFIALDAKMNVDENALFRQEKAKEFAQVLQAKADPLERKARELGIAYIPIGGTIGCLVNGAGLAMATMDLIAQHNHTPANFLDVGGGADIAQVRGAFELLFSNTKLKAIFVNIFGGIMRCDVIAQALVGAASRVPLRVPLVARLQGTSMEEAHKILKEANFSDVQLFSNLDEAIKAVCEVLEKVEAKI